MVYRFTIISDEVDNVRREIQIDSEATFLDFHNAILKSVGYSNDQMTSFFIPMAQHLLLLPAAYKLALSLCLNKD